MNSRRYWLIVSAISLVVALVTLVVIKAPRTVPLEQCSEVYRRYHDTPGIQASFIRNKKINDTLRLDMTLFKAEDSLAFASLLSQMGQSQESIDYILSLGDVDDGYRFTGKLRDDVFAVFPSLKTVAFFDVPDKTLTKQVVEVNLHEMFNITQ